MKILDFLVTIYLIAYFELCVSNFFVSSPPEEKGQGMQKNLRTKSYVRRSTSQGAKLGGELRWIRIYGGIWRPGPRIGGPLDKPVRHLGRSGQERGLGDGR